MKKSEKWTWKMQYCKKNNISPAQPWAWKEAEEKFNEQRRILKSKVEAYHKTLHKPV